MTRTIFKGVGVGGRVFVVILMLGAALVAMKIPTQNHVSVTVKVPNGDASATLSVAPPELRTESPLLSRDFHGLQMRNIEASGNKADGIEVPEGPAVPIVSAKIHDNGGPGVEVTPRK
jgi:hypothetical protein